MVTRSASINTEGLKNAPSGPTRKLNRCSPALSDADGTVPLRRRRLRSAAVGRRRSSAAASAAASPLLRQRLLRSQAARSRARCRCCWRRRLLHLGAHREDGGAPHAHALRRQTRARVSGSAAARITPQRTHRIDEPVGHCRTQARCSQRGVRHWSKRAGEDAPCARLRPVRFASAVFSTSLGYCKANYAPSSARVAWPSNAMERAHRVQEVVEQPVAQRLGRRAAQRRVVLVLQRSARSCHALVVRRVARRRLALRLRRHQRARSAPTSVRACS